MSPTAHTPAPHPIQPKIQLEVCLDTPQAARQALEAGADRAELCGALEIGGLTPGPALTEACAKTGLPVFALIRPRSGDFCYTPEELRLMLREISDLRLAGASGVVIGALTETNELDLGTIAALTEAAGPLEVAFHRAIDCCPDPLAALDQLARLGVRRVLSSGGASSAAAGVAQLERMVRHAAGRLQIMAGVGVSADNADAILNSGVNALHGSFSLARPLPPQARALQERLNFPLGRRELSLTELARMRALLQAVNA